MQEEHQGPRSEERCYGDGDSELERDSQTFCSQESFILLTIIEDSKEHLFMWVVFLTQ